MSKLEKFLAKAKKYTIGGVEFEFKPLTVDNIDLIMMLEKPGKEPEALKGIIKATLIEAGFEEKEVTQLGLKYFKEFVEAILDVNGLGKDKKKELLGTK